jgi:phosphoenolpyruvate-protein kinase (PTS system EI component)
MSAAELHLFATPYVSGCAHGGLRRAAQPASADDILILTQGDVATLRGRPAGLVVVDGAPLSHTLLALLGTGIPTVIATARQAAALPAGRRVWLDGTTGLIASHGDACAVQPAALRIPEAGRPVRSTDGEAVYLRASVRSVAAARRARAAGAAAIGLVRSEFLLPDDDALPDAAFYRAEFGQLCAAAAPLAVTVRLLDVAADKMPVWLRSIPGAGGVLGLQGVRLFGREPVRSVLLAQLAALDSLDRSCVIRLLIPYLVRLEELQYWSGYLRRRLSRSLSLGAMVETPAGALDLVNWFDHVDFVALGCNDLMQCLFAADRDRAELRHYLDPYAPLLYRFFGQVADAAAARLERVQLCGLLAQLPGVLPVLLGLGYRAFSVDVSLIPYLARSVETTSMEAARALAQQVCAARTSRQVTDLLGVPARAGQPFLCPEDTGATM